ncbi:hypothetical protein J6590_001985 [Homalodisca vitripennis]|nr:hypothetical protein J6590_001985 [Homalodisca vitripennis]
MYYKHNNSALVEKTKRLRQMYVDREVSAERGLLMSDFGKAPLALHPASFYQLWLASLQHSWPFIRLNPVTYSCHPSLTSTQSL